MHPTGVARRTGCRITDANSASTGVPAAAAIVAITLWRANEQYRPASRNQGRPAGSMRKSNRL